RAIAAHPLCAPRVHTPEPESHLWPDFPSTTHPPSPAQESPPPPALCIAAQTPASTARLYHSAAPPAHRLPHESPHRTGAPETESTPHSRPKRSPDPAPALSSPTPPPLPFAPVLKA